MKKRNLSLLGLLSISAISPLAIIISCSNNSEIQDSNGVVVSSEFQNQVDQWFKDNKLIFNFKNPIITEEIFNKYQNDYEKINKAFILDNLTDQKLEWKIENLKLDTNLIKLDILVINPETKKSAKQKVELNAFFSSKQTYIDGVYREVKQNLKLKPENENKNLIDLFEKVKTKEDLVNLFIIDDFLDVNVELKFNSQVINSSNNLKYTILLKDDSGTILTPSRVEQLYFSGFKKELIRPVTLLMESNLESDQNDYLPNEGYYGKTFLIKDQADEKLFVNNKNFLAKNITGSLDFSTFKEVEFSEAASFSGNLITSLKFNLNSKIINLHAGTFTSNQISEVELPLNLENFNISAFDEEVLINNLGSLDEIKQFYDEKNKIIYLNKAQNKDEESNNEQIDQMLKLVARIQGGTRKEVDVNLIVLPSFNFAKATNSNINKIKTKTIKFNSELETPNAKNPKLEKFETDLSGWEIESINIPDSVILIDQSKLPKNDQIQIQRKLNQAVLNLIETNSLSLKKSLDLLTNLNLEKELFKNLNSNQAFLDQLFYTFQTKDPIISKLNKIIIDDQSSETTLSINDFKDNLNFFKSEDNSITKTIEISKKYKKNNISSFKYFRDSLKSLNINLIRQKHDDFTWLDANGKLNLKSFQDTFSQDSESEPYKILQGLEDKIKSIDLNGVTSIHNKLFYELDFNYSGSQLAKNSIELDLSNLTTVGDYSFYNVKGLTYKNNSLQKLTTVGNNAFYSSGLSGNLNIGALNVVNEYSFAFNSGLTGVTFSNQLTEIKANAFYGSKIETLTLPTTLKKIGSSAFSSNNITTKAKTPLDLSHVDEIGANAFANNSNLVNINWNPAITQIADGLFQNTGLTTFDFSKITSIGQNAFSGTKLTGTISLNNVDQIGNYAFSNVAGLTGATLKNSITQIPDGLFQNTGLTTFDFSKITSIGQNAFSGTKLTGMLDLSSVDTINAQAFSSTTITTLKLKTNSTIASDAFRDVNTLTVVENFDFNNKKITDIFTKEQISKIDFKIDKTQLEKMFNYDSADQTINLSSISNWTTEHNNKFLILLENIFKTKDANSFTFKEVILPKVTQQNNELMKIILSLPIEKLTWEELAGKEMNFSLASKSNIKSINAEFTLGMLRIPDSAFISLQLKADQPALNLNTVNEVANYAFANSNITKFINTDSIKKIGEYSFTYQTQMKLPNQVEIKDNSFSANSNQAVLPQTVSQDKKLTKTEYLKIYDSNTKTLDFTKAEPAGQSFDDKNKWTSYLNIGKYLVRGDIDKIILPPVYVIWTELVDNLSEVKEIIFQNENQQIQSGAFIGTTIKNKPQQNQTNIIYDGDNFFKTIDE